VAYLVDAAAYFAAFAAAIERARKSILIAGWDIDSRIALVRDDSSWELSARLGEYLNHIVSRRRGLHAHVLVWDFAMIYALEREPLPLLKFGWRTHRRLHFRLDGNHPRGASHHQKIVVIDDSLAFVGGLDLTKCRWDTPSHHAEDPRRLDPGCGYYSPFHDVQMAVDGDVARALAGLVRERWRRASGQVPRPPKIESDGYDSWPSDLTPDIENVLIGVSRTEPQYLDYPEVREVEALYIDALMAAQRYVYIENQYLTSSIIGETLMDRLRQAEGPEIVLVLPYKSSGWMEEATMDALRTRLLRRLHEADEFGRLRVYYPVLPDSNGSILNVHSKVLVVDDSLLRIGSSNLSNRSMGMDTECDLSLEANGEARIERSISGFRNKLLGEHLGAPSEEVGKMINSKGSLIGAIEAMRSAGRTLVPMSENVPEPPEAWFAEAALVDPDRPTPPSELIEEFVPDVVKTSGNRYLLGSAVILLLVGLASAWRWTPLGEWLDMETILYWGEYIRDNPAAPFIVIAAYVTGGFVLFPVTVLIAATAVVFGPVTAFLYSFLGCLASASMLFATGHVLGRETVNRLAGPRLKQLNKRLARRGLITVLTVRIIPIAPYSVVNLIAGASRIRFRDYILGTIFGLAPGIFAITVLGQGLGEAIRNPKVENFIFLFALAVVIVVINMVVRRRLTKRNRAAFSKSISESVKDE
jgi:phosphatidylserine/phosphatidylglycerophosphate/cardiolipin synthase-like enzyme/uncharacterized membrane protein YdjX (TVP38/TMEM64 family)